MNKNQIEILGIIAGLLILGAIVFFFVVHPLYCFLESFGGRQMKLLELFCGTKSIVYKKSKKDLTKAKNVV